MYSAHKNGKCQIQYLLCANRLLNVFTALLNFIFVPAPQIDAGGTGDSVLIVPLYHHKIDSKDREVSVPDGSQAGSRQAVVFPFSVGQFTSISRSWLR